MVTKMLFSCEKGLQLPSAKVGCLSGLQTKKLVFCLALRSTCTTVARGEGRLPLDNGKKNHIFLAIVLNLHYLCP